MFVDGAKVVSNVDQVREGGSVRNSKNFVAFLLRMCLQIVMRKQQLNLLTFDIFYRSLQMCVLDIILT